MSSSNVYSHRHLVDLERKAFELRNAGRMQEAAEVLSVIVRVRPDWEHGAAVYSLASCYEDLGDLEQAENRYRQALRYGPASPIFLGGYASFLYLHGEARKAFASFLRLLIVERANRNQAGVRNALVALQSLGRKMGLSVDDVSARIAAALSDASE
jgi:Flp pilus assembly protein TadD